MTPTSFKQQNKNLQPSGKTYSENVREVTGLPVWTDGEQCVSCWKMTPLDRLKVVIFGRLWVAVLSGETQPPICIKTDKSYFL